MQKQTLLKTALILLTTTAALYSNKAQAQDTLKASGSIIDEGIKAYDTSNYKRAIALFASVPDGDTNYVDAQYELALAYTADSAYDKTISTAQRALRLPESEKRLFLILIANAYDYKGMTDSALHYYHKLSAINLNDHQPIFEIGVVHFRKSEFDTAIKYFQQAVLLNPSHFKSHQLLGVSYALQGRMTEAWICIQTSLLYATNYEAAQKPIIYLDGICHQTDEYNEAYKNRKEQYSHPLFDEIDAIINAKVILNEQYKIKSDLKDEPQAKLTFAIMEKLRYDKRDENFVMQYYVPLWLSIKEKDLVEPFFLQMYSGYEFETIEKLAAHQKSNMSKVKDIAYPYMNLILATRTLNKDARNDAAKKYKYNLTDAIFIEGTMKTLDDFSAGPVKVFKNGTLAAQGLFNDKGEKTGEWKYFYTNGRQKSIEQMKDGKLVGESRTWYRNGQLKSIERYNNANVSIYVKDFNEYGAPTDEYELVNEKEQLVKHNTFYESGKLKMSLMLAKKEYANGNYDSWFENGVVKRKIVIKDGELNGPCTEYYESGKLSDEYAYEKGKINGTYKVYSESGKLISNSTYKNGSLTGILEQWDEEGKQTMKQEYDNGKLNGKKYFYDEGICYGFVTYKDGKPQDYEFKDLKGKLVAVDKGPLKSLKIYFSNGNLKTEYPLADGLIEGAAISYYYGAALNDKTMYAQDKRDGKQTVYFNTGKISFEDNYKEDQRTGFYKGYFQNGKTNAEGWLEDDQKEGLWKFYNVNGSINRESFYSANIINGTSLEYNINGELIYKDAYFEKGLYACVQIDSNGKEFNELMFDNGNGVYKLLYADKSKIWFTCPLVNGRFHGAYAKYYPDGSLFETGFFVNGSKDSTVTFYGLNGAVTNTGHYKNGNMDGEWKFFNELGEQTSLLHYKNNELEGKRVTYNHGFVSYESNYKEGQRSGVQYIYGADKQLAVVLYFDAGILMSYTYEGKDGKLLPNIEMKNGSGKLISYYSNGQKSAELNYQQSLMEGKQIFYYSNGNVAEERNFINSDYNGVYKEYHPNGKVKMISNYKDDELHGLHQEFDDAGNLIISKNYFFGELHGIAEIIDRGGKSKKLKYRFGYPIQYL